MLAVALLLFSGACTKEQGDNTTSADASQAKRPAKPAQVLSFPASLHVEDETVNAFVERTMNACAKGDYDEFRLLWSAQQQPLDRAEFEAGWLAVQAIEVRALERIKLATKTEDGSERLDDHYLFMAEVRFDPQQPAGRKKPTREVVLLLTKEEQQWRLARAPAKLRDWLRDRVAATAGPGRSPTPQNRPDTADSGTEGN